MKTHNQEMLELLLNLLQAQAVSTNLAQADVQHCTDGVAKFLSNGDHGNHELYVGFLEKAHRHSEFCVQEVARTRAKIMELCHD